MTIEQQRNEQRNETLEAIAKSALNLDTLETRNSDEMDFTYLSAWSVKEALQRAYMAGAVAGEEWSK